MKKNKLILANAILVLACLLLNVVCFSIVLKISENRLYVSALLMIPLGSIISSMIGGRIPGILTTLLSVASFYVIDACAGTSHLDDWRIIAIALATTLICSVLRYSKNRQKVSYNIVTALIISIVNIVINFGYWKHVSGVLYSISYDLYLIILVPLVMEPIVVLACFFFTKGYRSKLISCFDSSISVSSNFNMRFPIGAKFTVAISVVVISLVTAAVLNNSKTFYDRIAHTMDMKVADTALDIVEPYNPGDIVFSEAWEKAPEAEKERLKYQIANAIENNTNSNTIIKAELVKVEKNEEYEVISAKVIGTFYPYDSEEGYMGAAGIRYDDTEKTVDLNRLIYGDVHGWSFESNFFSYIYLDEDYELCLYMNCREMEEIPAHAYNQLILSCVVAMLVGTFALLALEVSISIPLQKMTRAAEAFVNVDESQREKASREFSELDIHSHDEVANLYQSFEKATDDMLQYAKKIKESEAERIESERRLTKTMLDQSIETLAYTIDAKDKYTKGHSSRVAKYARMIATVLGKSEEECREVYLAGLLHDIGKISINGQIINKPDKLTDEEYEKIKKHPSYGATILNKMRSIPYLKDGALYHHERYDGKGYPTGIKGDEIPEIARIISVADAYDAMTSYRSYRPTMDQSIVKQELWKGMGTQFDPLFAKVMISLIDADVSYKMREIPGEQDEIVFDEVDNRIGWPSMPKEQAADIGMMQETNANSLAAFITTESHWCKPSEGIPVSNERKRISFHNITRDEAQYVWSAPVVLVYSSDDGTVLGPNYVEHGVFMGAGYGWQSGASLYECSGFTKNEGFTSWDDWIAKNKAGMDYTLDVQLEKDTVVLSINNEMLRTDAKLVFPENYSKKFYVAIAGERSDISDVR